jgi:hypothetical protein
MVDSGSSSFPATSAQKSEVSVPSTSERQEELDQEAIEPISTVPPVKWSWTKYVAVPTILSVGALLSIGYWRSHRISAPPAAASASANTQPEVPRSLVQPYPRARWRIAPRSDLSNVVLFVSHILIRHKDAEASSPPFGPLMGWTIQPPPPERSAAEAVKLAEDIAVQARQDPRRFAELARTYSEDITTRDRGGSFGGMQAAQFIEQTQVLDALAQLKPGELSRPVQTRFGFHVLQMLPVPEPVEVCARHIVLGHDSTDWLQYRLRPGKMPHRTREQALLLARELADRARAKPGLFARLVASYSEHRDAADQGDIGVWSTREAGPFPRVVDTVAKLQIGEISEPLETPHGVEIFERTPVEPRGSRAASIIRLRFDPNASQDNSASEKKIAALAASILKTLSQEPARFASFQEQYCCAKHERWTVGRGDTEKTALLEELPIGGITRKAVVLDYAYTILKRLDPAEEPPEAPLRFELPNPARPDLDQLIKSMDSSTLAKRTRDVARATLPALQLSGQQGTEFESLHDKLAKEFESKPLDERQRAFQDFHQELEQLLGREKLARYVVLRDASVIKMLIAIN